MRWDCRSSCTDESTHTCVECQSCLHFILPQALSQQRLRSKVPAAALTGAPCSMTTLASLVHHVGLPQAQYPAFRAVSLSGLAAVHAATAAGVPAAKTSLRPMLWLHTQTAAAAERTSTESAYSAALCTEKLLECSTCSWGWVDGVLEIGKGGAGQVDGSLSFNALPITQPLQPPIRTQTLQVNQPFHSHRHSMWMCWCSAFLFHQQAVTPYLSPVALSCSSSQTLKANQQRRSQQQLLSSRTPLQQLL